MSRPSLESTFSSTTYRAFLDDETFDLHVGQRHAALEAALRQLGASRWIVLSPGNPGARRLDEAGNARRMALLESTLETMGLRFFAAVGLPAPGEDWPPEASLLILDAPAGQALGLARQFGQLAWLEGETGGTAALKWTQDAPAESGGA